MTRFLKKQTTRTLILLTAILIFPAIADAGRSAQVGLNKSVMIDLKNSVQRCESADPAIAGCVGVSPRQVQINGLAPGKTTLTILDERGRKHFYSIRVKELQEIAINKSLQIDTQKPIKRWKLTNPTVINCIRISPTRLQINGIAAGETSLTVWDNRRRKHFFDISVKGGAEGAVAQSEMTTLRQPIQQTEPAVPGQPVKQTEPSSPRQPVQQTESSSQRQPVQQTESAAPRQQLQQDEPAAPTMVALHNSLKVNLSKPVQRCESADPAMVECSRISPKQLHINGVTMGRASLTAWFDGGGKQIFNIHVKGYKEIVLPESIIDLPKPVQRCEPIDSSIIECIRISPTQLRIRGSTLGKTTLAVWEEGGGKQVYDINVKGYAVPLNKIEVVKLEYPSSGPRFGEKTLSSNVTLQNVQPLYIMPIIADTDIAGVVTPKSEIPTALMSNGHYRSTLLIRGAKIGETSLIIIEDDGRSQTYDIFVRPDLTRLETLIREAAPHDHITVSYANDTLVLSGRATNDQTITKIELLAKAYAYKHDSDIAKDADTTAKVQHGKPKEVYKILNLIQIDSPQQVMLEVKVAQVDKIALKNLGVTAFIKGAGGEGFSNMVGMPTGQSSGSSGISGTSATLGAISSLDSYQFGFSLFKPGIGAVLRALVTKNQAKILAEPNLLVKSGQEGRFLAGQKVPLAVLSGANGTSTTTIQYENVGVKINFKPEVMENGLISLSIDPAEVSNISGYMQTNGYPIIDTREVRTSVQLKDGESLVLAGLLQEETIKVMSKIPLAGDIPILGALFRSTQNDLREKELVFFITPRLVKPTAQGVKSPLPTDARLTPEQEEELRWMPRK